MVHSIKPGRISVVAVVIVLAIARLTRFNIHPDEAVHVGAFDDFRGRWFPPDIGADGVVYGGYG